MHILAITDIHGRQGYNTEVNKLISNADLVVIAGDLTNFGHDREAKSVIQKIQMLNEKILAICGNCDYPDINNTLETMDIKLQETAKVYNDVAFYGLAGCTKTPFSTPQEYSEQEIAATLAGFRKYENARYHVLVTHSPPAKTNLDRTFMGLHVGSKAIRDFIKAFKPDLVVCGHIHEARGVDKIGETIMINPGQFPKHYAIIDMSDKITYRLY